MDAMLDLDPVAPSGLDAVRLASLPRFTDHRGSLSVLEGGIDLPFDIARVYYLYQVPATAHRAGHALKSTHQIMIAVAGAFTVTLDDGRDRLELRLDRPDQYLYVPPMVWRLVDRFERSGVCLCMVSRHYDPDDYYRDHDAFLAALSQRG